MLSMRIPNEKVKESLALFIDKANYSITLNEETMNNMMIVEEGSTIIGFANYVIKDEEYWIDHLYIEPSFRKRKIGDGLIRALLNLMDRRSIRTVFMKLPTGFAAYLTVDSYKKDESIYTATLPDFFEKPCKGSAKS